MANEGEPDDMFRADRVATRTGHFLAEENAAAAPDVASRSEERLELAQLLDARPLRLVKLLEKRLRVAPHLLGVPGEQPPQPIRCFSYIQNWVEMKIRRHLARACQRRGFGWKRWSREWLYDTLGLFSEYRVSYVPSFSAVVPN